MMNILLSYPLLHRISRLAVGTLLITASVGYGSGAIAAPLPSLANKDALSDLFGDDSPILDAVTSVLEDDAEATDDTDDDEASIETNNGGSTETAAQSSESTSSPANTNSTARFTCQYEGGNFVVMYSPESEPGQSYEWAIPGEMGGGWTPERRCNAIAERLENYRPDGLLELQTGVENNYNVVCVTTAETPGCRIVFTVPNDQDPLATRDRVFENLAIANSGQDTAGVTTFTGDGADGILTNIGNELGLNLPGRSPGSSINRGQGIDLRPFLDPADGGTGAHLGF
ncbi:MAG: COP23 domain-containing protein [Leptolyngbyaceae cyanobacterium]